MLLIRQNDEIKPKNDLIEKKVVIVHFQWYFKYLKDTCLPLSEEFPSGQIRE